MANKKTKYQYATIQKGKAVAVDKLKQGGTEVFEEVGIYTIGKAPEQEPLLRQDIGLMKTHIKNIKRADTKGGFFERGYLERDLERQGYPAKMSLIMDELVFEYQRLSKDKEGRVKITKLKPLADRLGCTQQDLKDYLVNIAGYLQEITIRGNKSKKTGKWREVRGKVQLFEVFFEYSTNVKEEDIKPEDKVGTKLAYYIKNSYVTGVYVKPHEYIRRSIEQGEGYGFLYTTGKIPQLAVKHSWGENTIKLYNFIYTYENNPSNQLKKICYDKLVKHLDLEDYVKQQGNPRTKKAIKKAFETLKQDGQLERYTTPDKNSKRQMYSWVRSYKDTNQRRPKNKKK